MFPHKRLQLGRYAFFMNWASCNGGRLIIPFLGEDPSQIAKDCGNRQCILSYGNIIHLKFPMETLWPKNFLSANITKVLRE